MLANEVALSDSGNAIDQTIAELQTKVKHGIAITKAQEDLHKNLSAIWNWSLPQNLLEWKTQANSITIQLERLFQSHECLTEIDEEAKVVSNTIDKLRKQRKHWDQAYQQYPLNNYQYIDSQGILHESTLQYLDTQGRVHAAPMHFFDTEGKVHAKEYLDEIEESLNHDLYKRNIGVIVECHLVERIQTWNVSKSISKEKKLSYIAANHNPKSNNHHDKDAEIAELQKQLNDQITESVWQEKDHVRLQEHIKHLQQNNMVSWKHFTRVECAFIIVSSHLLEVMQHSAPTTQTLMVRQKEQSKSAWYKQYT